ncbi:hypothetical protein [Halothermothrix orenii]|uniref:DNA recombination-mediator protein A n=1 Tax=Halothermothrix orenii (strain H 168 / OCM 544 / DSM 9562) TaxID=373903 RepID=B8CW27_HALOH|nr:hypothetical protein [Halothermothrix orenii]ACL69496.1 hypothetical protein Hore_07390 [Halothermothrix orenii H 168]
MERGTLRYYAGIGSRKTPQDIKDLMYQVSTQLAKKGYILRSGGSPGADDAFEYGVIDVGGKMEVYLPWKGFRNKNGEGYIVTPELKNYNTAIFVARKYHPAFDRLDDRSKKLFIRDTYQVLGKDLKTKSSFVLCWTEDGCLSDTQRTEKTGGTGQVISIASYYGIPVFNLKIKTHRERIEKWLNNVS